MLLIDDSKNQITAKRAITQAIDLGVDIAFLSVRHEAVHLHPNLQPFDFLHCFSIQNS